MTQNENGFSVGGNCHSMDHYELFFSPSWLLLGQLGFLCPFTFIPKEILAKREFLCPFNTTKYSQPLELVIFHVTSINNKCHKGSYYLYLLINYFFN